MNIIGWIFIAASSFIWVTIIVANLAKEDEACRPAHVCDACGQPAPIITKTGRRLCIDCATGKHCTEADETLWYRGER